jgi:hypothetical protein
MINMVNICFNFDKNLIQSINYSFEDILSENTNLSVNLITDEIENLIKQNSTLTNFQ